MYAIIENGVDPDQLASEELRRQLIRIHSVFCTACEFMMINQNMNYRTVLTLYTCPGYNCPRTSIL